MNEIYRIEMERFIEYNIQLYTAVIPYGYILYLYHVAIVYSYSLSPYSFVAFNVKRSHSIVWELIQSPIYSAMIQTLVPRVTE